MIRRIWKFVFYGVSSVAALVGAVLALGNEGFYRDIGIAVFCFFLALILIDYTRFDGDS